MNSLSAKYNNSSCNRNSGVFRVQDQGSVISASNGDYLIRIDHPIEIDAVDISDITFHINDSTEGASNGALGIFDFDMSRKELSSISIKNIDQTTDELNFYALYGVNYTNQTSSITSGTLKAESIVIDGIKSTSAGGYAFGMKFENANVNYGIINISNIEGGVGAATAGDTAIGLWGASTASRNGYEISALNSSSENSGFIYISNVKGGAATGANFEVSASGKGLVVSDINANGEAGFFGMYGRAQGVGFSREGIVRFDTISISQISSEKSSALGLSVGTDVDFFTECLRISSVNGVSSTGLSFGYSEDNVIRTNQVDIQDVKSIGETEESIGVDVNRRKWEGNILYIGGVYSSDAGIATGIKNYSQGNYSGEVRQKEVYVTDVSGGSAYGINNSVTVSNTVNIPEANFYADKVSVNKVVGNGLAYGVYNAKNAHFHVGSLILEDIGA